MRAKRALLLAVLAASIAFAGCVESPTPQATDPPRVKRAVPVINLNASLLDTAQFAMDERFGEDRPLTVADIPDLLPKMLTNYNITLAYLLNMSLYPNIQAYQIGETLTGRAIIGYLMSDDGKFHADRPSVMLTCSQHGNEPSGSEACLVFIEYFTHGTDQLARDVRTKLNLLVNPLANPDGKESNRRGNYDQVDINRDHMNLVTLEGRAIHEFYNLFNPLMALDLHEFGGAGTSPPVDAPVTTRHSFQIAGPEGVLEDDSNVFAATNELLRHIIVRSSEKFKWGSTGYYTGSTSANAFPSVHRHHFALRNAYSVLFETGISANPIGFRAHHQVVGAFAAIEWLLTNQARVQGIVKQADADASRPQSTGIQGWLIPPQKDMPKALHFLGMHGVNYTILSADKSYNAQPYTERVPAGGQPRSFANGTIHVSRWQPDGRLVFELFENTEDTHYRRGPRNWPLEVFRVLP